MKAKQKTNVGNPNRGLRLRSLWKNKGAFYLSESLDLENGPTILFINHLSLLFNMTPYDLILGHLPCLAYNQQMVNSSCHMLRHPEDTLMVGELSGQDLRPWDLEVSKVLTS